MRSYLLLAALLSGPAWARPVVLPLQGQLTDTAGVPIDGPLNVTFRLYSDPSQGPPLHIETVNVDFDQGAFTLYLGSTAVLDSATFSLDQEVWLGIQIAGDQEMELIRVGWTPLAAFAAHAGDAESLDGYGSADFLPSSYRPDWTDIRNRPPGLDDGDNVGGGGGGGATYTIGQGLVQDGDELSVDPGAIYGWAEQVCYDSVTELRQSLDGVYLTRDYRPAWTELTGKPAGFADDVDDDTRYTAGDGLTLTGTLFSVDFADLDARVRGVCFDTEAELHAVLDGDYLDGTYRPAWGTITGVPAGFADGVDDAGSSYVAGPGVVIDGNILAFDQDFVGDIAAEVAYDTEEELRDALDDVYLPADYRPSWNDLTDVPPGFADGTDDGAGGGSSYTAGQGIQIAGGVISADAAFVRGVCYDNEAELRAALDGAYLPADYTPAWSSLTDVPAGFADGVDDGVTYTAGSGVRINGATLSVDDAYVQGLARGVCFDTEAELTAVLNDNYLPASYAPAWSSVTNKPAGFADDVDDDALAALACADGLSPMYAAGAWTCADLRVSMADPVDLQIALSGVDLDLGAGTTIDGMPISDSVYTDADAVAAVQAAMPELRVRPRNPLVVFETTSAACRTIYTNYGGMIRFPTRFSTVPSINMTIDESIDNSGASWSRAEIVGRDRWYHTCNVQADAASYIAMDRGVFTIDGKRVEAGYAATARTNDTIFFPTPFDVAPIVLIYPEGANNWARVVGSALVSTGGFNVQVNTNDKALHWIAMTPGDYHYGAYHWEAGKVADPDNNDRFNFQGTFTSLPGMLFSIGDTNSSGANYARVMDVTTSDFQLYVNDNNSEYLYYVAFEEDF